MQLHLQEGVVLGWAQASVLAFHESKRNSFALFLLPASWAVGLEESGKRFVLVGPEVKQGVSIDGGLEQDPLVGLDLSHQSSAVQFADGEVSNGTAVLC